MDKIRILLADDHTILRQGLRALLEHEADIEVIAETATGEETVELTMRLKPSIVVLDIGMADLNGFQAAGKILEGIPIQKIIILSMTETEEFVLHALQLGVCGYLVKQTAATELLRAIREVEKGNAFFSPSVARRIVDMQKRSPQEPVLSIREREILEMVAEGKSNKVIADILCVSIKTVQKHRQQLMNRLNIHEIAGLTKYALAKGLTRPEY